MTPVLSSDPPRSKPLSGHHVKELLTGSSRVMAGRLVGIAAFYGTSVVVARWYGIGAYGRFALGVAVVSLGSILAKLGVDLAVLKLHSAYVDERRFGETRALHRQALGLVAGCGAACTAAALAAAEPVAVTVLHEPGLAGTFRAAALGIAPLALMNVLASSLRGFGRLSSFALTKFASVQCATLIFAVGAHLLGLGVEPIWGYSAAIWATCAISAILVRRSFDQAPRPRRRRRQPLGDLLILSAPLVLAASGWVLIEWTDSLLLASFMTEADVGTYQAAYRLASVTAIPLVVVNATVAAQFSVLYQRGARSELAELARLSSVMMLALTLPPALLLAVMPGPFLRMFGDGTAHAGSTLLILVVAQVVNVGAGSVGSILGMANGQRTLGLLVGFALLTNIGLNLVLIPRSGIDGSASAQLAAMVVFNGAALLAVRRQLGFWALATPAAMIDATRRGVRAVQRRGKPRPTASADQPRHLR